MPFDGDLNFFFFIIFFLGNNVCLIRTNRMTVVFFLFVSFWNKGKFPKEKYRFLWIESGQNTHYKVMIRKTLAPLEAIIRSGNLTKLGWEHLFLDKPKKDHKKDLKSDLVFIYSVLGVSSGQWSNLGLLRIDPYRRRAVWGWKSILRLNCHSLAFTQFVKHIA